MIPYGRQSIDDDDVAAVVEVLRGDWLTQGPTVERFEEALAERVEARHAVTFSSGTAALHGAAAAAGFGEGDLVVTSPLTFMATANCVRYVGARPGLVDIDPATWNLDPAAVPDHASGVIPVHYAGLPVTLDALPPVAGRVVIEDAAHALGASTPDGPVGNCARSAMTCFSLHPVKPITSGEGGVVTTNDDDLAERLRRFRSHGMVRRPDLGGWVYEISEIGYNYRLTDIQAALGLSQLGRLDRFIDRRNDIAAQYRTLLADLPITLPPPAPGGYRHGYHLFAVMVPDRRAVYDRLRDAGVATQVHYVPVHHHPLSADIELPDGGLPVCDAVYEGLLSLPMFPDLGDDDVRHVAEQVRRSLDV
jgi:UDP-4-amino-4,6-dideoxy-N-acetyl-beta-L-altrosamine transaminase